LKDYSQRGRTAINLANRIELPPLLFKESDFYLFHYPENRPNYIGFGNVTAKVAVISDNKSVEYHGLAGCIVLISQADPGYDWLFGQNIVGLITKWGGANSHMAIRCAEFGLPAAIGVGELEFQRILKSTIIELDPGNHRIQIIR
jgi:phosphohistidine swiveling domain-containing protein